MLDQNTFTETLREVAEIIRTSATPMTREEVLSYFSEMELTDSQKEMVFEYLKTPHEENEEEPVPQVEEPEVKTEAELPKTRSFLMYVDDVKAQGETHPDELEALYERLLKGDETTVEPIAKAWLNTVMGLAAENGSPKVNLEDLIQEGNLGLFLKLREICGSKEPIPVGEVLKEAVISSIKDYISEMTGEEDSENTILGKVTLVTEAVKYLREEKGAEPGLSELSEFTRLPVDELSDILDIAKKAEKK